jgi:hypothetical protein
MATRSIITNQPDVACDVCGRRLLRGEQSEVFLAAGQRRTVCELCSPRAAHQGWLREADRDSVSLPPLRAPRGRNLFDRLRFDRLRRVARPAGASAEAPAVSLSYDREPEPYELLDGFAGVAGEPSGALVQDRAEIPLAGAEGGEALERAIEVFNAGEYPRRVAGVARSLGLPAVSIRPVEDLASVVAIVVAWELCWYRYEVDLGHEAADTRVLAQGTELAELAHEDRLANAVADELGALSLSGA